MLSLQEAVRLISSDKAKERSEGIELYKDIFNDSQLLQNLTDGDNDGRSWLHVMQALFVCVQNDKITVLKKGVADAAPISLRRLKESAHTVQWTVEKACSYYPQSAFLAVFEHLTQSLDDRGCLFEPLATDYLKALRVLLSYRPHIDHLDQERWTRVTGYCFNILLNDFMDRTLDDCEVPDLFVIAEEKSSSKRMSRVLDAEVASCLQLLVSAPYAPLVGPQQLGLHVLGRYAAFLLDYPTDCTAHLPALQGLNHLLSELEVNESSYLCIFAEQVWPALLALWSTKSRQLKEQVTISFRILLPLLSRQSCYTEQIASLQKRLLDEPDQRFALQPLSLSSIDLCSTLQSDAYQYSTLRARSKLSVADGQSWAALELAADCTLALYDVKAESVMSEQDSQRPVKKQKQINGMATERPDVDAVQQVVERAMRTSRGHDGKALQVWSLQVLLYISLRHMQKDTRSDDWIVKALPILVELVSHTDVELQSWSLLILATLVPSPAMQSTCKHIWPTVCRRITQSGTTRAASHAASAILISGRVQQRETMHELHILLDDLEQQSLTYAYDSTCSFFTRAILLMSRDAAAARSKPGEKVLAWLQSTAWTTTTLDSTTRGKASGEMRDPADIVSLLCAVCGFGSGVTWSRATRQLPVTPIVTRLRQERQTDQIKAFISTSQIDRQGTQKEGHSKDIASTVESQKRGPKGAEVRTLNYVQKNLKMHLQKMRDDSTFAFTTTLDQLSKAVNFAIVSLMFSASLQEHRIASQDHIIDLAHELLHLSLEFIVQSRWTNTDVAAVLASLCPLLLDDQSIAGAVKSLIQVPGKLAGIDAEVQLDLEQDGRDDEKRRQHHKQMMETVWKTTRGEALFTAFEKIYERIMGATPVEVIESVREQDDEMWAGVPTHGKRQDTLCQVSQDFNEAIVANVCISAMLAISHGSKTDAIGQTRLKKYLLQGERSVQVLLLSGSLFFDKVSRGELAFATIELDQVVLSIGDDLLTDYRYEKTIEAQVIAIDFLDGTLSLWHQDEAFLKNALKLCSYFVRQINKETLLWRVEERLVGFLEHFVMFAVQQDSPLLDVKSPVLAIEAVIKSLLMLNGRADTRLRWTASTMTARLFGVWAQLNLDPLGIYEHIVPILPHDMAVKELMATRILVLGNTLVANSPARHVAFWHLIELVMAEESLSEYVTAVLGQAAQLLGFASIRDLWMLFATQVTWALVDCDYNIEQLPYLVLGYSNQSEMLRQSFHCIASMLMALGSESALEKKQTLATLAGKTQKEASLECIPFLAATDLVILTDVEDAKVAFKQLTEEMASRVQVKGHQGLQLVRKAMADSLDAILVSILRSFYEPDLPSFARLLQAQDPKCASTLEQIEGFINRECHEPTKPNNPGRIVYRSITLVASQMKETFSAPTVYSVVHQMVTLIHQERLINDQHRHIQALKLYLCLARKTVEESTSLIRILLHSCAVLIGRVDLVDAVWPLLDWVIDLVKSPILGVSSSLIVMLRHSSHFTRSRYSRIQQVGIRLSERLGRLVLRLKESGSGKSIATETICAWPSEYPATLTSREWDISIAKYTNALQATLSISAALLQRISRALQRADADEVADFRSSTIWIILDCLDKEELDDEERGQIAASLADLLHYCNGKFSSPSGFTSLYKFANRSGELNAINRIDIRSPQPLQPLKSWLTRRLVRLTRSTQLESAEAAVLCLRAIFAEEPQFAGNTKVDWDALDAEDLRLITFFPAASRSKRKRKPSELEAEEGFLMAVQHDVWVMWICGLLCDLMADKVDGACFSHLSELVSTNATFAKESFAVLVHIFLRSDLQVKEANRVNTKTLSRHVDAILRRQQTDKRVWKAIIQAIVQLRHDDPTDEPLASDRWLPNIDYFLLQRRAVQCHLYATAVLLAELEHEHKGLKTAEEEDAETRLALQYKVYSNIDDPDSFYGIKNPDVRHSLVKRLHHEGQWDRLFDLYAAQNEGMGSSVEGIATTLHHQGFNRLSLQLDEKQSTSYSAAWRMEKWDLPVDRLEAGTSQSLYSALRAIHNEKDGDIVKLTLQRAYECEYKGLTSANVEANCTIRSTTRDLLGLREISHWHGAASPSLSPLSDKFDFDDVERIVSVRLSLLRSQRRVLEASQMGDIPSPAALKVTERECSALLSLSQEARRTSKLQIAINSVTQAQQLAKNLSKSLVEEEFASLLWDLGDHATAIESLTTITRASQTAQPFPGVEKEKQDDIALPLALARLGQWRATARSHQPRAIRDECFAPAAKLASNSESLSVEEKASVFYQFAAFAHQHYKTLMKSTEGDNLDAFIRYRKEEVEQLEAQFKRGPTTSRMLRAKEKALKLLQMDTDKLAEFDRSKMKFRKEAAHMYAYCLPITDAFDDKAVIRLVSLWFENANDEWINKDLSIWLKNIPSRKFLPFVHQLSSRLSHRSSNNPTASLPFTQTESCNTFSNNVKEIVYRMCLEHPFHALTPLYALSRADDDKEGRVQASRRGSALLSKSAAASKVSQQGSVPIAQILRKEAAIDIIARVASQHCQPSRIKEWKRVCDACVQWARFDLAVQMPAVFGAAHDDGVPRTKAHVMSASFNLAITRLHNVNVPVLTSHLAVDETGKYDDVVSIAKYSDRFTTAGGVHLPKITDCIGSNGKMYKQLFKNLDDLRQDAVMQQVFGVLNGLLATDREAKKRQLRVRTYAVIPLGPRYGLLEFVGNTRPLQAPLMATHQKYRRPGDITPRDARAQLATEEFQRTRKEQVDLFDELARRLPPTFRFHFLERHKVPITLLTNRLNYTRSVATTSIVGHILGLGDRHVSNILLDDMTGEVIHIDFGVAFDQGKLLPIPELVPFRLTRDIVDAMGLHGVEGVYRRCCQETLRVMREGASVIETVLQVFKYDPLYDWTQNPVKVIRAQAHATSQEPSSSNDSSAFDATNQRRVLQQPKSPEGGGKDVAELLAERAIGTVMEKLSTSLSVEYTVNDLMMQARDPVNLGAIFSGWQAAL